MTSFKQFPVPCLNCVFAHCAHHVMIYLQTDISVIICLNDGLIRLGRCANEAAIRDSSKSFKRAQASDTLQNRSGTVCICRRLIVLINNVVTLAVKLRREEAAGVRQHAVVVGVSMVRWRLVASAELRRTRAGDRHVDAAMKPQDDPACLCRRTAKVGANCAMTQDVRSECARNEASRTGSNRGR